MRRSRSALFPCRFRLQPRWLCDRVKHIALGISFQTSAPIKKKQVPNTGNQWFAHERLIDGLLFLTRPKNSTAKAPAQLKNKPYNYQLKELEQIRQAWGQECNPTDSRHMPCPPSEGEIL